MILCLGCVEFQVLFEIKDDKLASLFETSVYQVICNVSALTDNLWTQVVSCSRNYSHFQLSSQVAL